MNVRDIMTWNVITVSSDTEIMVARKVMETHHIRRLPVVDRDNLVGIVTLDRIIGVSPSPATSLSIWEVNYLLAKMTVKEIMNKEVVTIDIDASVEQCLALGVNSKIGILPVLENGQLVGVVTITDYVTRILFPIIGIGSPGTRLNIAEANKTKSIRELVEISDKGGYEIESLCILPHNDTSPNGFMLHVNTENTVKLIREIEAKGYKVIVVKR